MKKLQITNNKDTVVRVKCVEFNTPVLIGAVPEKRIIVDGGSYNIKIDDDSRFVRIDKKTQSDDPKSFVYPVIIPMSNVSYIQIDDSK